MHVFMYMYMYVWMYGLCCCQSIEIFIYLTICQPSNVNVCTRTSMSGCRGDRRESLYNRVKRSYKSHFTNPCCLSTCQKGRRKEEGRRNNEWRMEQSREVWRKWRLKEQGRKKEKTIRNDDNLRSFSLSRTFWMQSK